jgi:hypothetical protein
MQVRRSNHPRRISRMCEKHEATEIRLKMRHFGIALRQIGTKRPCFTLDSPSNAHSLKRKGQ